MPAAKHRHLLNREGRYWARLVVPETLRPYVMRRELLEALGADRVVALRKLPAAVGRMQDKLEEARAQRDGGNRPIQRPPRTGQPLSLGNLAKAHFAAETLTDDRERAAPPEILPDDPRDNARLFQPAYEVVLRNIASGRFSDEEADAAIGWAIEGFRQRGNTHVKIGSPEWRQLARTLASVHLETLKQKSVRDDGAADYQPTHPALTLKAVSPGDPLSARIMSADSERTYSDLAEQYLTERPMGAQLRHDHRAAQRLLRDHLGGDLPIYQITRQHVQSFKRVLQQTPTNYTKRFPGFALADAIKANKARATPFSTLTGRTINNKYLNCLHSVLAWAVRSDIIPDNPASGIKAEMGDQSSPPKVNFSPADLTALFGKHFALSNRWGELQWAMVLSLYTGARASELAQVKLESVRTERGVMVMAIEEAVKNAGSRRLVPVHAKLIELGFEKLLADLKRRKATHLFPVWYRQGADAKSQAKRETATLEHYWPRFLPRSFNRTYLPKVGINDPRKTWHSFRHTFKTGLAMAGVGKDMRDVLCGHVDGSAGAAYVHGGSIEAMKEAIDRLRFDFLLQSDAQKKRGANPAFSLI